MKTHILVGFVGSPCPKPGGNRIQAGGFLGISMGFQAAIEDGIWVIFVSLPQARNPIDPLKNAHLRPKEASDA